MMVTIDEVQNKQETSHSVLQKDLELKIGQLKSYVEPVEGIVNRNLKTEVLQTQSTIAHRAQELLVTHGKQRPQLRERPSVYYKTSDDVHEALNLRKLVISSCAVDPRRSTVQVNKEQNGRVVLLS